jgi:hypothetical protein
LESKRSADSFDIVGSALDLVDRTEIPPAKRPKAKTTVAKWSVMAFCLAFLFMAFARGAGTNRGGAEVAERAREKGVGAGGG